eukprot:UN29021
MNAVTNHGYNAALSYKGLRNVNHADFSIKIPNEGKPITSQKSTGRCWQFAVLNVLRIPLMKKYNIEKFEYSQVYLYFYDKLERCNFMLNQIINTTDLDIGSRVVQHLLKSPMEDGGQFDMMINLIEKYGICPKQFYPEVATTKATRKLRWIGHQKFREWSFYLRSAAKEGKKKEELIKMKAKYVKEWYNLLCIYLGSPPRKFNWIFTDKDKKFQRFNGLTPQTFYEKFVLDSMKYKMTDYVSLINDPRNSYKKGYTVDRLGNVIGAKDVLYVNVSIDDMKKYAIESLKDGEPVWFGCHFGEFIHREKGILDRSIWDHKALSNTTFKMEP